MDMDMFRALHFNEWERIDESNVPLHPLELSKLEYDIIIARMKKLAKDPSYQCANALQLVHDSYKEQEWERQNEHSDFQRPTPSNKKAWEQYEKFIELSVKLLSKFRGIKGDWRTDRFGTIPTNDRSSMGSMAASKVESWDITWDKPVISNIILEELSGSTLLHRSGEFRVDIETYIQHLCQECDTLGHVIVEGVELDLGYELHIHKSNGDLVDTVTIKQQLQ